MSSGIVESQDQEQDHGQDQNQNKQGEAQDALQQPGGGRSRLVQRLLAASANLSQFIDDLLRTQAVMVAGTEAAGFIFERTDAGMTLRNIAHVRPDNSTAETPRGGNHRLSGDHQALHRAAKRRGYRSPGERRSIGSAILPGDGASDGKRDHRRQRRDHALPGPRASAAAAGVDAARRGIFRALHASPAERAVADRRPLAPACSATGDGGRHGRGIRIGGDESLQRACDTNRGGPRGAGMDQGAERARQGAVSYGRIRQETGTDQAARRRDGGIHRPGRAGAVRPGWNGDRECQPMRRIFRAQKAGTPF